MQMPRERSSLNQLETNLKPLENFKVSLLFANSFHVCGRHSF